MSTTPTRSFLDRILTEGRDLATRGEDAVARGLGVDDDPAARGAMRKTAAVAGVAGLLLGSRRGRKLARTGVALGGLGFLGKVAWDAWNTRQGAEDGSLNNGTIPAQPAALAPADRRFDTLGDDEAETRARRLALAMITAAKADGHIDAAEREMIEAALSDLPADVRGELSAALLGPADPAPVADGVTSQQEGGEIYAASYALSGRDHPGEVAYLDALARALGLPPDRVAAIEVAIDRGDV